MSNTRSAAEVSVPERLVLPTAAARRRLSPFHRAKLAFLVAGLAALTLAVVLWFWVDREQGLFVGLWVPAIHSLGALVLAGEDRDG